MKKIILLLLLLSSCWHIRAQISINEGFESTSNPTGWVYAGFSQTPDVPACVGSGSLRRNFYNFALTGSVTSANYPAASNGTAVAVAFTYKTTGYFASDAVGVNVNVQYSTDNGITWTTFGTPISSTVAEPCTVWSATIPAGTIASGQDFKLKFDGVHTAGDCYFYIDNVTASQVASNPPSCAVLATPASGAISVSSSLLSWLQPAGAPTGYKLTVGTSAGGTDVLNNFDVGNVLSYNIGALALATTYYVKVVPYNAIGSAVGPCTETSFTTCPVALTTFFEDMESVTLPNLPDCWVKVGTKGFAYTRALNPSSGLNSLYISSSSATDRAVVKMSNVSNLGAGTHRLSFKMRGYFSVGGKIEIGYLTNSGDDATFVALGSITAASLIYESYYFNPVAGIYSNNLAIRHSGVPSNPIFIDDVSWEPLPAAVPDCAVGVTATADPQCGNFATSIAWTADSNTENYKLSIGTTSGGTQILNNVVIGNVIGYQFSGAANTTYYYKLTPYNAVGDAVGCVEQSYTTFATGCYCPSVPTSNDGNGISNVQIGGTDFPTTDLTYFDLTATAVSLQKAVNANVQVTFATGFTYDTNVWIDFNDNFTFEASELVKSVIATVFTNPNTLDASFIMPLTAALGTHRMRIATADSGQATPNPCYSGSYGVTLDFNVTITAAPACIAPQGLAASAVTATTATVSWTALTPAPATGYEYVVSASNVTPTVAGIATTAASVPLTLLTPVTQYYVFVRSNCGGSFSAWSSSITFTTPCAPVSAPATENFSTFLPACWTTRTGGDLTTGPTGPAPLFGGWGADGFANVTSVGAIDVNVWQLSTLNDWIISPQFTIPATGYKLQFDAAATQYLFGAGTPVAPTTPWEADDKIEVLVSTTGTSNWTVLNTFTNTNQPSFTGNNYVYSLDAYNGQTVRIAFRAFEGTANGAADIEFSIDNFNVSNVLKTESFDLTGFASYPNPVKDILNISYIKEISNVSIYNLLGQEVMSKSVNASQSKIDMSNLNSGTYLVKVTVDGLVKTIKVLKQ